MTIKIWRDDGGQWYQIDGRGRPRNPFDKEGCAVLDKLFPRPHIQNGDTEKRIDTEPAKVCATCLMDGCDGTGRV